MINYGIIQNPEVSDIIEDLPIMDLDLYEDMGNDALKNGASDEGLLWYTKGLYMAKYLKRHDKTRLFENLILTYLEL